MKFIIEREQILKPLQQVNNSLGNRLTLPILGNLLLQVTKDNLLMTSTNLEIEIIAQIKLNNINEPGEITIPARKFYDICRSLPEGAKITVTIEGERILIRSKRSRYSLSTLPASNFPSMDNWNSEIKFTLQQSILKRLIESTQFSMAHQDVRYYLNGMLFETKDNNIRTVATDGHRLAVCTIPIKEILPSYSVIVPRKSIIELMHMLDNSENMITIQIGSNKIRVNVGNYIFTSKLIDGRFPDYRCVLPKNPDKILEARCDSLRQAFARTAIISNEKIRSVRLYISTNQLTIIANNPDKEEAEEKLDVNYQGNNMEISLNVNYILEVLNTIKYEVVRLLFTNETSSVQIIGNVNQTASYIIMPMRL